MRSHDLQSCSDFLEGNVKTFFSWLVHSDDRPVADQVWSGLKLASYVLAGFACITIYIMGLLYAVRGAPLKAVFYLGPSLPILYFTAHRWVKILPGFLGLGALAGMRSNRAYDASEVILFTTALGASAVLSLELLNRKLNWIDRVAVIIAVTCPLVGASMGGRAELAGSLAMPATLAIPWLIQRAQRRKAIAAEANAGSPHDSAGRS